MRPDSSSSSSCSDKDKTLVPIVVNPMHHTNSTSMTDWSLRRPRTHLHLFERFIHIYIYIYACIYYYSINIIFFMFSNLFIKVFHRLLESSCVYSIKLRCRSSIWHHKLLLLLRRLLLTDRYILTK